VMAHQSGLDNVVAVLGTALGPRHIGLLRRFADRITLVLAGDEAGQRRTNEILELFVAEQVDLRILTLPEGLDPCDYLLHHGADAFRQLLAGAVDALEHRIRTAARGIDPVGDLHAANRALEEILATLAKAPRLQAGTTASVRLREQQTLSRLAREFALDESQVRQRLSDLRRRAQKTAGGPARPSTAAERPSLTTDARSRELLEILCLKPQLAPIAKEGIPPVFLPADPARKIYETYCDLTAKGEYADMARVLSELETPELMNLLVTVDWESHDKAVHATEDPESRLRSLITDFARRKDEQQLRAVQQGQLAEEDALDELLKFVQQERSRQGISAPTDG